jgi:hypothetical protein
MRRTSNPPKEETCAFTVPADLKVAFDAATEADDRRAADVLRDFMQAYVEQNRQVDEGHDAWFRACVQAAIDDHRPGIPHDIVRERTRAIIDRIATEKARV